MIDKISFDKYVYLVKDLVRPPYYAYKIYKADARDKNKKGCCALFVWPHHEPKPKKSSEYIKIYQDEACYEDEAEVLIKKLRHTKEVQAHE